MKFGYPNIGKAPLSMPAGLREPDIDYRYTVLDMHQVDCSGLLTQDNPDALVLAMLCDFGERQPQAVVNGIFLRLRELLGDDSRRLREYIDMIEVLSENRDLKSYVKEAESMLTQVNIEQLPSYELGMEKGMETGMEKGMEKGMERGVEQGVEKGMTVGFHKAQLRLARNLLDLLSDEVIAERMGLPLETVVRLRNGEDLD